MIRIVPISANADERGYTAEYLHERSGNQLILYRKAGTVSGRHYHKGRSATKDPEILLLLHGSITLNWRHVEHTAIQTQKVDAPCVIEVPAMVWHELITMTDCVMAELNSMAEHAADTFYL